MNENTLHDQRSTLPTSDPSVKSAEKQKHQTVQTVNSSLLESCFHVVLGLLISLTFFLPGELAERTGIFHLPCILWLLTAAVWVILPLLKIGNLPKLRFLWLDVFVYGFFAVVCFSIGWNLLPGHGGSPRPSLNMLSVWLGLAAVWFLFRQILYKKKTIQAALGVVLAVMTTQSLLGLDQYFIEIPEMLRQFETHPEQTIAQIDPSVKPDTPEWDHLVSRLKTSGPIGTYPMSNSLGGLLGCTLIFLLGFLAFTKKTSAKIPEGNPLPFDVKRFVLLIITGIVLVCFTLTKCRSGFVAVGVGLMLLALFLLRSRLEKRLILIGVAVVAILVAGALATSGKSLISGAKRSLGFRLEYWQASVEMIRDNPLFGCGSGNFKQTYTKYKLPQASEEISDPHNFAVEIASVSGLPALLLFILLFVAAANSVVNFKGTVVKKETDFAFPDSQDSKKDGLEYFVYLGGLLGCYFAYFLSFNNEVGIDTDALILATIVFPFLFWIFRYSEKESPSSLLVMILVVFFVHLSAAGGISVTSTAIGIWLLLAILANRSENIVIDSRFVRIGLAVFLITAIVLVHQTSFKPILDSRFLAMLADEKPAEEQRISLLQQATKADPWSSAMQERLATALFEYWQLQPNDPARKSETMKAQQQAVDLMPRSAMLRFMFAERLNLMFEKNSDNELAEAALKYYGDAIDRYPNLARFRAPYTLLLWKTAGNSNEKRKKALQQRDLVLKLDDLMPHTDQKLTSAQREKIRDLDN